MADKPDKRLGSLSSQRHIGEDEESSRMRKSSNPPNSKISLKNARLALSKQKAFNYDGVEFITLPLIREYWMEECPLQDFLKSLACSLSSVDLILDWYLRIFTASVLVKWDSDGRFREVFQRVFPGDANPIWKNDFPIFNTEFRLSDLHLSLHEKNSLVSNKNLVSVPVLDISKESKPFPDSTRLPITSRKEIGKGAYGRVYEIQIAEACLKVEDSSGGVSLNKAQQKFALKEMRDATESQRELEFLRKYRASSRKSAHIVVHLAIIERSDGASVIYPLAIGDLQKLLEGKLESYKWCEKDAEQFCDIVRKSCDLADGLEFLHNGMDDYSDRVCRHGDLKPNNFLIFSNGWKISDMGLAKVKTTSNDETGVRKTTKTSLKDGGGPYAAPEMSLPEGPEGSRIGRGTDVWSLAAIVMELIIWGLGGPQAWTTFVNLRGTRSGGLFHQNNTLSSAVDDELRSWPKVHCKNVSKYLRGNEKQASQVLKDLVKTLREAFEIDPEKRAKSKAFLNSMREILKHIETPSKVEQGKAPSRTLEIRTSSSTTALGMLRGKLIEHKQHILFTQFKPNEQICVSNVTESEIRNWIRKPTPSALCILTNDERLKISAITYEVYYTARSMGYQVVKFLTLDRYGHTVRPLQASLDLVYCFIAQLLDESGLKPQEYDLDSLATEDPTLSDEAKFEAAVNVLGKVIETQRKYQESKPTLVIVDEFWGVCPRSASDATKEQWNKLLALLGCATTKMNGKTNADPSLVGSNFKVLIRAKGWFKDLERLGFSGRLYQCDPLLAEHGVSNLRTILTGLSKKGQLDWRLSEPMPAAREQGD